MDGFSSRQGIIVLAALMNAHYVNIKVDREERPDLDDIYMMATQVFTQSGGWPMSVWLTPDLKPFFGGTYFPPDERHGHIGPRAGSDPLVGHQARGDASQNPYQHLVL